MLPLLARTIDAYAATHPAEQNVYYRTPVPGLSFMRATAPTAPLHSVYERCLCVVAQGLKWSTANGAALHYRAGEGLVVEVDVPLISRVAEATDRAPFLGLKLALVPDLLAEVAAEVGLDRPDVDGGSAFPAAGARVVTVDPPTEDALVRLAGLADAPQAVAALHAPRLREVYYWLLSGPSGALLARLALPGGPSRRIAEAVRLMKAAFPAPLRVERLAEAAGMGRASFHAHFKAVTGTTPLQYYKRLRLLEARRLVTARDDTTARDVAYRVGYESPSQFSRDYARTFGVTPGRDEG